MTFVISSKLFAVLLSGAVAWTTLAYAPALHAAEEKALVVRFYDDPAGFDPANIFRIENENIAFNIFSGLTSYDSKTGKIIPDLAESWETKDNLTWTFTCAKASSGRRDTENSRQPT